MWRISSPLLIKLSLIHILRWSNSLILGGSLVFGLLYGVWKQPFFLTVAMTLCAVLVLLLVALLAANIYFEKKH